MREVYLSIGSNVDPARNVPAVIEILKQTFPGIRLSPVYETEPVGPAGREKFWNLAAALPTLEEKPALTARLRTIEEKLGRVRSADKYAPRPMDIDILPQPEYQSQAFIMIPLAEIAPEGKDAESGKTFLELAKTLQGEAKKFRKVVL
jgi:2-amino-4-hydroxy-6-hydroxymethyldihydropteridine diphosphokinase